MKAIDSVIESAQSEEELQKNLIKINKTLHGDSVVNSAIDMSESPEELTDAMVSLARKKRVTKEDQNQVLQGIYATIRGLGYASKPLDVLATPFTESARQLPKLVAEKLGTSQTPPVDIAAPFRQLEPSKTFGLSTFLTDLYNAMGIQVGPTANFNETEFAAEYPVAANILSELTNPANIAGMLAEGALLGKMGSNIATDPATFTAGNVSKIQDKLSDWYLSAIQKDTKLSQALKDSGKWNDVVRYFTLNRDNLITPFNKEKALDFLEGPTKVVEDIGGQTLTYRDRSAGEIGRLTDAQEQILSEIPTNKFTLDPVELNKLAKESLPSNLLQSRKTKAEQLIDESLPYYNYDQNKIDALNKVASSDEEIARINTDIQSEKDSIISALDKKKVEEMLRLKGVQSEIANPQYREDLQWLSKLPVVEGDNIFPKTRSEYVTDITYPDDPMRSYLGTEGAGPRQNQQITTVEESFRSASPTVGQNQKLLDIAMGKQNQPPMIDNPNYYALKADVDNKILMLNSEIESVRKLNLVKPENYNRLSKLIKQRDELVSYVNMNIDPTFSFQKNPVEAYKQYITDINQLPATAGTSIRRRGNELIEGSKMNQTGADIAAEQAAGLALNRAGSLAEQDALGYLPSQHDRYNFNSLKAQQALALNAKELLSGNRVNRPSAGGVVPVGDPARGIIREILSTVPEYGGPMVSRVIDKANAAGVAIAPSLQYSTIPGNMQSMNQPSPYAPTNFIPRGIPLQDPMMKAHAIDAIGRDKQNTPARNAERMMKIINEGIFED